MPGLDDYLGLKAWHQNPVHFYAISCSCVNYFSCSYMDTVVFDILTLYLETLYLKTLYRESLYLGPFTAGQRTENDSPAGGNIAVIWPR